jgi:hypothetical protein
MMLAGVANSNAIANLFILQASVFTKLKKHFFSKIGMDYAS